ncbi:hypothetical protein VP01_4177g2 [Puccinia sorghi]|uniref:Reverse transcriptase Ty1/copia-type domain-containing protein n=1 Tax=Puccinia sorghi TaxID=27349 RepID=A0A0L6UQV6_9BASI|nr:hypothetical protein VP01_4177g2 [Puccinia sorghi]
MIHSSLHVSYHRIRQCLGIPVKNLSSCEACAVSKITRGSFHTPVGLEAKRIGYYPTIIHSDRGTEFVNSRLLEFCNKNLIRTRHNSSGYRSEKTSLELNHQDQNFNSESNSIFFKPVGICVSCLIQPERHNSKLELLSYKILDNDGRIVNSKHLTFLDLPSSKNSSFDDKELTLLQDDDSDISPDIIESDVEISGMPSESLSEEEESDVNEDVADSLSPNPTRTLCDRTSKVKPVKYSYLTGDPTSFKRPMLSEQRNEWSYAVNEELEKIEEHDVWEDQNEEPKSHLKTVWIFKTKPYTLSSAERKKACLCIQGFLQIPDKKKYLYNNLMCTFLFAPLKEEIYIKTPEGSKQTAPFLKLKKSLYGLKQAPANLYDMLKSWFNQINFIQSTADPCLFIHKNKHSFIFFHVDDLIVIGDFNNFEDLFLKRFPNSTTHDPNTLLDMDLDYDSDSVALSQRKLIDKGLELAGIKECHPVNTPLSVGIQLCEASEQEKEEFKKRKINFRTHTGILNYLACQTRSDLAPAVSILSGLNHAPIINHWQQVIHC